MGLLGHKPYKRRRKPQTTAAEFKQELKFRAAKLTEVVDLLPDGEPVVATVKVDGMLVVWEADVPAGVCRFWSSNDKELHLGTIPAQLLEALRDADITSARGAGELYAEDDQGRPLSFEDSMSVIGSTAKSLKQFMKADLEAQLPIALVIFDVFEVDGTVLWGKSKYADRMTWIYSVFGDLDFGPEAIPPRIKPVIGQTFKGEAKVLNALWKRHVLEGGYEGLVIRANGSVKIKPVITVDVAVVGYTKGKGKAAKGIGALLIAFRGWDGAYEPAGKVGSGFTDAERVWWLKRLRKAKPFGQLLKRALPAGAIATHPDFVIEVAAERFTERHETSMNFRNGAWVAQGGFTSRIPSKPRFVRLRSDKTQSPYDLRMSQVPGHHEMGERLVPERGDDGSFKYLLELSRDDLIRINQRKQFVDPADFDDVYNDTVVKAMEMWRRLNAAPAGTIPTGAPKPGKKLITWLAQIMKNRAIDVHRKTKRRREKLERIEFHDPERARRAKPRKNPKRKRRIRT